MFPLTRKLICSRFKRVDTGKYSNIYRTHLFAIFLETSLGNVNFFCDITCQVFSIQQAPSEVADNAERLPKASIFPPSQE